MTAFPRRPQPGDLYINQNGLVTCAQHGGVQLRSWVEHGLSAYDVSHGFTTDLDHWMLFDRALQADAAREDGVALRCETCHPHTSG